VPPDVQQYFQRDLDRTKKATTARAREKLRLEAAATEGNNPFPEAYDEEAELQREMNLSKAKT
jgi:predicted ATPase